MRSRSRGSFSSVPGVKCQDYVGTNPTPSGDPYWIGISASEGTVETIDDTVFPNFSERKKRGEIMVGSLSRTRTTRRSRPGSGTIGPHPTWGMRKMEGYFLNDLPQLVPPADGGQFGSFDGLGDVCLAKAYAEMNKSTMLVGEQLADFGKTVSMLRHPFGSARELIQRISDTSGRLRRTLTASKAFAHAWLEHRYGWKPLINDAISIIKEANAKNVDYNRVLVARAGRSVSFNTTKHFHLANCLAPYVGGVAGDVNCTYKVRVGAGVIYRKISRSRMERLNQVLGTRLTDIPTTLWEITPWSFVVDWFMNVGDWIAAITPNPYVDVLGSWITLVRDENTSYKGVWGRTIKSDPVTDYTGDAGSIDINNLSINRQANPSLANLPTLLPLKVESVTHTVSGLSLLATNIIGDLRRIKR